MFSDGARGDFVQAFERGLAVILSFDGQAQTLSQVAQKVDMSPAAARRYLSTLADLGYLSNDGGRFSPQLKLIELARPYYAGRDDTRTAQQALEELSVRLNETTSLTQLDGTDVVNVLAVQASRELAIQVVPGNRLPAYCTAMGRAMLSQLSDQQVLDVLKRSELTKLTPTTKVGVEELLVQVGVVREQGYALVEEEYAAGIRTLSIAFRLPQGQPAALSVPTPVAREALEAYVERVLEPLRQSVERIVGR